MNVLLAERSNNIKKGEELSNRIITLEMCLNNIHSQIANSRISDCHNSIFKENVKKMIEMRELLEQTGEEKKSFSSRCQSQFVIYLGSQEISIAESRKTSIEHYYYLFDHETILSESIKFGADITVYPNEISSTDKCNFINDDSNIDEVHALLQYKTFLIKMSLDSLIEQENPQTWEELRNIYIESMQKGKKLSNKVVKLWKH